MWHKHKQWILPVLLMGVITPFTPWIDLNVERFFYQLGEGRVSHFPTNAFLDGVFVYGLVPGQILAVLSMGLLLLSYFKRFTHFRPHAQLLVLTLAVGGGLIINVLLKDHWGRPRPKQVEEFGGLQQFRPYYEPNFFNQPEPSKSFPCGHCSMGFYFFALALVGKRVKSRSLSILGMVLAVGLGALLSVTRMAQGGHFFSDVVMSALIMWLTALFFEWLIYERIR